MVAESRAGAPAPLCKLSLQVRPFKTSALALALVICLLALLPLPAPAQTAAPGWTENGRWRSLTLVPGMVADFTPRVGERSATLRAGEPGAMSSPVFRDDSGRLRALPGGVVVILKSALNDTESQALFRQQGIQASRKLADTVWLIEASVGLPSLELANRLQASGAFASAQPNWWMERRLR